MYLATLEEIKNWPKTWSPSDFPHQGSGKTQGALTSFELALRDAGIAAQNLVRVSSIFPPNCKLITRKEGLKYLSPGEVVFAVVAENSTREPHRLVASSIGLAMPADRSTYGYLSEHHSFGETDRSPATTPKNWPPKCSRPRWTWNSIRQVLGRKERSLPAVEQDRAHRQHHADRCRRQERPVDDGHRRGHPDLRITVPGLLFRQRLPRGWLGRQPQHPWLTI